MTIANRRNFYRLLHVQPDAPDYVIKNNYRTLMQTLRMHPDLGGEESEATDLNLAYSTLRKPMQREVYDRELRHRIEIATIAKGHFSRFGLASSVNRHVATGSNGNRRNYYRLLHVQTDTHQEIIDSSYQKLIAEANDASDLYKEAYAIIGDPLKRAAYDQSLMPARATAVSASNMACGYGGESLSLRCVFCSSPHSNVDYGDGSGLCMGCASPLLLPDQNFTGQPRRWLSRTARLERAVFYSCWPGIKLNARITDLSPTGIQFETHYPLLEEAIIKIDAEHFKAVGKVAHVKRSFRRTRAGIQFLTVQFNRNTGTFVSSAV